MSEQTPVLRRLYAGLCLALLVALTAAAGAQADSFGEITHMGARGTGAGQFSLFPFETDAFGVDPTDNSVYVVDLPDEKNEFRIQKFSTTESGEFKLVASVKFKPKDPAGGEEADTVEGFAIDPAMHRLYVLALEEREKPEQIDFGDEAASELFAFSTEQKGSELLPATGTTEGGVLASTKVLKPQGKNAEESLLEPTGIAVEPIDSEHDNIAILGEIDTGKKDEHLVPILHDAVWRVSSKGELLTGSRYVDSTDVLEEEGTSPVVFNKKLYVEGEEGLYEIPASGAPKPFTESTPELVEWYEELRLWQTPAIEFPRYGAGLSAGPEGTFWSTASIRLASEKNNSLPGAVSWNSSGNLIGFVGGQSIAKGLEKCIVKFSGSTPLIAAGKEWTPGGGHVVFVLDNNTLSPKLIQFGPGGGGCPGAEVAKTTQAVLEVPVGEGEPISIASTVEFSSEVVQADALEVEWKWGDGSAATVIKTPEHQSTFATHKFLTSGTHEVVETIHTDNLTTPTIVAKAKVNITGAGGPPTVVTGTPVANGPTKETLKGTVNPNGSAVSECVFEYGETTSYGKTAPCSKEVGAGSAAVAVEAEVTGLKEGTEYHFLLKAKNGSGSSKGEDSTFKTAKTSPPPVVTAEAATAIGNEGATLHGKVNPNGSEVTECKFEYGTALPSGKTAACTPKPGTSEASVSAAVSGLTKGTVYKFVLIAKNAGSAETAKSTELELKTTAVIAPSVTSEAAGSIGKTGATLHATVNPNGSEVTECKFEYGPTTGYGFSVPCSSAPGAGTSPVAVSAGVSGLSPGLTYHFRILAKNAAPTPSVGSDVSFATEAESSGPPPPTTTGTTTGGVLPAKYAKPVAKLAASSVSVPKSGAVALKIACAAGSGSCAGTVVLKTAAAVVARASLASLLRAAVASAGRLASGGAAHVAKSKAAVLTLASGSFSITEGQSKLVTLHLSAKAKKLLAKKHRIAAKATITARNPAGETNVTPAALTLKKK